mmetsp:Transcript_101219/g.216775  ORF Transcript_101219/g.216775 Transcript_101219/m.216775 type:complete len:201 (+) Transcript_101219:2298-2900(+)
MLVLLIEENTQLLIRLRVLLPHPSEDVGTHRWRVHRLGPAILALDMAEEDLLGPLWRPRRWNDAELWSRCRLHRSAGPCLAAPLPGNSAPLAVLCRGRFPRLGRRILRQWLSLLVAIRHVMAVAAVLSASRIRQKKAKIHRAVACRRGFFCPSGPEASGMPFRGPGGATKRTALQAHTAGEGEHRLPTAILEAPRRGSLI